MEDNKTKKNYFSMGLLVFLWLLLVGGLSFAFFSIVFHDDDKTSTEVVSGLLSVQFTTDEYIDNIDMLPINDDEIFENNDVSVFSIQRASNNTTDDVYYNIYLEDIEITDNYKSQYIKWRLYNETNPGSSSIPISEGNFSGIGNNTTMQLNNQKISLPKNVTHNYTLYVWISNYPVNQSELLEGSLSAKIKIDAITE